MSSLRRTMRTKRDGFTLIELLMSISIITILATLAIAVLRGAEDDARQARTATVVGNIRTVIQRRMEAYETRMMPFRFEHIGVTDVGEMRAIRKRILTEWFRSEMPTSFADLEQFPSAASLGNGDPEVVAAAQRLRLRPPAMVSRLRRAMFFSAPDATGSSTHGNDPTFEDAECLYAILYNSWDGDRRGTHFLTPSEIGDTDGDGLPEVLDGWGDPLIFQVLVARDSDGDGDIDGDDDRTLDPDRAGELNDFQISVRSQRSNKL